MSLRHAVLGFLSSGPLTGYDLKKHFDGSVRHFWTADQAQIYRALARLVDDDLVTVHVVRQDGRPDRREHHITAAGRAELDAWLRTPLERHDTREPFLMKVYFAGHLSAADLAAIVDARIAAAARQLDTLRNSSAETERALAVRPPPIERLLTAATLEHGLRHLVTELEWLRDLRRDLRHPKAGAKRMRRRRAAMLDPDPPASTGIGPSRSG